MQNSHSRSIQLTIASWTTVVDQCKRGQPFTSGTESSEFLMSYFFSANTSLAASSAFNEAGNPA